IGLLEHCVREDLNRRAPRAMAVLRPLKIVLTNYPAERSETLDVVNHPDDASAGTRAVPFGREIYIERDDFLEDPPKKYFRLTPGREVRLRNAYLITCQRAIKNDVGEIVELQCTYDPATRGGDAPDGRKVKATLHWVSAAHAIDAEVRLYERLFTAEDPESAAEKTGHAFLDLLNRSSLDAVAGGKVEPMLGAAAPGDRFQFERLGYFAADSDSRPGAPVFNRTVSLKETWTKSVTR
ncbi:MAG: glutamine--tRNA ligase, partial [Acidobacteriota bacterium]